MLSWVRIIDIILDQEYIHYSGSDLNPGHECRYYPRPGIQILSWARNTDIILGQENRSYPGQGIHMGDFT